MRHYADHLEELVGDSLTEARIDFEHESEGGRASEHGLDFYIPAADVFIEVKQYHSQRIAKQTARAENVIVLQGEKAVKLFATLLNEL